MTQVEYDIIIKCIKQGVPALADSLILSLNNLVISVNNDVDKNEKKTDTKKSTKEKKGEN